MVQKGKFNYHFEADKYTEVILMVNCAIKKPVKPLLLYEY